MGRSLKEDRRNAAMTRGAEERGRKTERELLHEYAATPVPSPERKDPLDVFVG